LVRQSADDLAQVQQTLIDVPAFGEGAASGIGVLYTLASGQICQILNSMNGNMDIKMWQTLLPSQSRACLPTQTQRRDHLT